MKENLEYKPWEEYPEFWKTEAMFWSYIRGGLRRGLWEKSPIKIDYKRQLLQKPPEGYTGRAKSGAVCALTGEWTGNSKLQVDHIEGNVPLRSFEDLVKFIIHLVPPKNSIQLVEKEAHKVKSYAERMGVSFERALATKSVIAIEKDKEKVLQWFTERDIVPESNSPKRRIQMVNHLMRD